MYMVDATTVASIGLAVATGGLVVATAIYAYYTKKLVGVTERTREDQTRPIIRSSVSFIGPVAGVLRCQNIGIGSATDLSVTLEAFPQTLSWKKQWDEPLLLPGGFRDFFLPFMSLEEIKSKIDFILLTGECKDAFGSKQTVYDKFNVKDYLDKLISAKMRVVESRDEILRDIVKGTEGIKKSLDDIKRTLEDREET